MTDNDDRTSPLDRDYVSMKTLAALLDVTVSTIHRMKRSGRLPKHLFIRLGPRLVRVDMKAFREWLDQWEGTFPAQQPVQRAPERPTGSDGSAGDGGPRMTLLR